MIPLWLLTVIYVAVSFILGLTLPRLEVAYSPHLGHDISVSSAQALLASIASGMMSLAEPTRKEALRCYTRRLDDIVTASSFDADDRAMALIEDPQGIGLSRVSRAPRPGG